MKRINFIFHLQIYNLRFSCALITLFALHCSPLGARPSPPDSNKVNTLSFALNLLTHGELVRGGLPAGANADNEDKSNFILGRTRFTAGYSRTGLEARAVIQNLGVWGASGNQALNLYEAWAKMTAKNGLFAQAGRIALAYDDERIIGTNDFAMASLSHDVLRAGYEGHGHQAHAIVAYNQNAANVYKSTYYDAGAQPYKTMQTLWYHYDVPQLPLGASLLFMNVGLQAGKKENVNNPPATEYQQMYGAYLNFHPKYVTIEGSYYRQGGKTVMENKAFEIDAWMASAKATVTPNDYYGFTLGYDYLSGDDFVPSTYGGRMGMPLHKVFKGFAPLYGSRTKFYGLMDYFYQSAYINSFTPGLQNAFVGAFAKPTHKFNLNATYHYLAVATELYELKRTLGHSIEMNASYSFSKDISLAAGYTLMFGTETMDCLKKGKSDKTARWGWFSLVISPTLFTTKF